MNTVVTQYESVPDVASDAQARGRDLVVMRHGRKVAELTEDISSERLVRLIVGVDAEDVVAPDG